MIDLYDQCHQILFNKFTHKASIQLPWPLKLSRWLERWFEMKHDIRPQAQQLDRECTSAFQGMDFSSDGVLPYTLAVNDELAQPLLISIWADWEPFSDDLEIRIDHFIRRYCRFGPVPAMVYIPCFDFRNLLIGLPSVVLHAQHWRSRSSVHTYYFALESEPSMESLELSHRSCKQSMNSSGTDVVDMTP